MPTDQLKEEQDANSNKGLQVDTSLFQGMRPLL